MTITSNISIVTVQPAGTFDIKEYLKKWIPGTNHEAIPHGVPTGYVWREYSTRCQWPGSTDAGCSTNDYTWGNWWGVIYTDTTNVHPSNTRVNVWKDVKMLYLYEGSSQWQVVQRSLNNTSSWGGCGYKEDFSTCDRGFGAYPNQKRLESDGTISYVPLDGHNVHFYPGPFIDVQANKRLHCITIAYARLIKADPNGIDDRPQSKYIIDVGGDDRNPDADQDGVQRGFVLGKFIKPTNQWRSVVASTLSLDNLNTLQLPPAEHFIMPDGSFPS